MSDALGLPGGPAFPVSLPGYGDNGCGGMSLRDYFAARALPELVRDYSTRGTATIAALAYELADAMLAEREKGKTG